ncbi:hypothetical protein [Shimia sp. FJ5]|nr:hypothetical protein [Shimia sp. FJ5]MDV4143514.1 hypothetical protein [Shimia sp. FJ5]
MRKPFLFVLSAGFLFAMAAYQAQVEPPQEMAGYAFKPGKIEVETLQ